MSNCASCKRSLYSSKQCLECSKRYCRTCLPPKSDKFCSICKILNARPANRNDLMNMKPRDLKSYLAKRKYPVDNGCLEKEELVVHFLKYVETEPTRKVPKKGFFSEMFHSIFNSAPDINRSSYHANSSSRRTPLNNYCSNHPSTSSNPSRPYQPYSNFSPVFNDVTNNQRRHSDTETHDIWTPPPRPPPPNINQTNSNVNAQPEDLSTGERNVLQYSNPSNDRSSGENSQQTTNVQTNNLQGDGNSQNKFERLNLSNISSVDELKTLSVKQMKEILFINRVDFKGCFEKEELVNKVEMLWEESQPKGDYSKLPIDDLCKICMDGPLNCVLLECGHIVSCIRCGKQLAECPVCRQLVTRVVHTFKA